MTSADPMHPTLRMAPAEAASYWFVRRDGRELSVEEAVAFEHWMAASPEHEREMARMTNVWAMFDGAGDDPHLASLRAQALAPSRRAGFWKLAGGGLVAAALVIGVTFGTPVLRSIMPGDSTPIASDWAAAERYATAKGEMRILRLADGSRITLNTGSEVQVAMTARQRSIRLVRGQALFDVAHDASRPFVVTAADRQVTALGTIFEVRVDPDRMEVMLVRGKVAVDQQASAQRRQPRAILNPGESLLVVRGVAQPVASVDVGAKLRWREGFVEFADAPLAEVVGEMNRYTDHPVVLQDPQLAAERISGVFRTGDPDRFVAIVGELVPVEAQQYPDHILLTRRTAGAPSDAAK